MMSYILKPAFMQTIEIKNGLHIGFEDLFKGVQQLDNQALAKFVGEVNRLVSSRLTAPSADREAMLLKKLKTVIPATVMRRQKQLYRLQQQDALSSKEREELLLLNQILEEKSAERILILGELASLKGIPIGQLTNLLKRKPAHAPA